MKKLVLILTSAMIAHSGFAQITIDPEVGMTIANLRSQAGEGDASNTDGAIGFSVGAGVHLPLSGGLYVKPGLYYQMLGGSSEEASITSTTRLHYLTIPVNLGYRLALSEQAGALFAEAGPYVGYALAGSMNVEGLPGGDASHDIEFGSESLEMNAFDWGFNFGLGYETPWGIYVKGGYGLGLGNLSNVTDANLTNRGWRIGLGYRIQL